ncbi:hypothetical protein ARMSODRAFT_1017652 [Armillaria solidipes]|uniref:Peptidase C14 n=1 Tax=Armillaria solidipes TaxID=1076256 RepID=A0A2H3C6E7_9AGAR|nr:hypothetical protein ARMSODRAFT_1017652 [Armillaria solidipes]
MDFLMTGLHVPSDRIQLLLGSHGPATCLDHTFERILKPTRTQIVESLSSLANNGAIDSGDQIMVFYSGHGTSYRCNDDFTTTKIASTGSIQAICPLDRDSAISPPPIKIRDISGREISVILSEIVESRVPA